MHLQLKELEAHELLTATVFAETPPRRRRIAQPRRRANGAVAGDHGVKARGEQHRPQPERVLAATLPTTPAVTGLSHRAGRPFYLVGPDAQSVDRAGRLPTVRAAQGTAAAALVIAQLLGAERERGGPKLI
ncbi:MAG: hypothetical protein WKG07_02195 [Hymenobacter sp.]